MIDDVRDRYGYQIAVYTPDAAELEAYVADNGINGFYRSVEQRKGCCYVRKVRPLQRALAGRDAWITGMRRSQGQTRGDLAEKQWDDNNLLWKYSPPGRLAGRGRMATGSPMGYSIQQPL